MLALKNGDATQTGFIVATWETFDRAAGKIEIGAGAA